MKEAMELLNEALRALNWAPRFKYDDTNSYELASKISQFLKSMPLAKPFTDEMLMDILTTAFEAQSWYWCVIEKFVINEQPDPKPDYPKYGWVPVYNGNSIRLIENDVDEDEAEHWEINRHDLELALTKIALERPQTYKRLLEGEYDAADADVFLQIAAIGQVTYG